MKRIRVKNVAGVRADVWFLGDWAIQEFMSNFGFVAGRDLGIPGLSFVPANDAEFFAYINEDAHGGAVGEFKLVRVDGNREIVIDTGTITENFAPCGAEHSFCASGTYLDNLRLFCER